MGYVRITEALISGVSSKIHQMQQAAIGGAEVENAAPVGSSAYKIITAECDKEAWAEAPELKQTMPQSWGFRMSRLRVMLERAPSGTFAQQDRYLCVDIEAPDGAPFRRPKSASGYMEEITIAWEQMDDLCKAWMNASDVRAAERQAIVDKYNKLWEGLCTYLNSTASLNAALKDMPELELYVPEEFLERWRKPVPKKGPPAKVEMPEGLDRTQLASLGIAHRITTANE